MSDETVVIQSRDRTNRTVITWYADTYEAERENPLARVGAGGVWVDDETDYIPIGRRATNLYRGELLQDPWQDLSWLCTHTRDGDGYVRPILREVAS